MTEISLKKRFPNVSKAKLALARLGEPESIVREKPYGSKIVLTKNANAIEIVIPDRQFPIRWGIAIVLSLFILPIPLTIMKGASHFLFSDRRINFKAAQGIWVDKLYFDSI